MKVLEHFVCGKKGNSKDCEDGLVIGKNLIAVIDGVTPKGKRLWDTKTSGCYAKDILKEYLMNDVEKQKPLELLENLNRILCENSRALFKNLPTEEYPRASIIIYNNFYKEIWSYGDCQCRINDDVFTHSKRIDEINADLRAFYLEYQISQGANIRELSQNDVGRKAIEQNLIMQFEFENKTGYFGYPVLNGQGINESLMKCYPVKEGDIVILASDGYPILKKTLKECEDELAYINQNDPMYFRLYRSTKGIKSGNVSYDDRCFCKFKV